MAQETFDPLVFGQRLRYFRKQSGATLDELGETVGRSASYLSQLENGHREPRLSTVNELASALNCRPADLLSAAAPNRRAELEVALAHMQEDPRYQALRLPYLKASARLDAPRSSTSWRCSSGCLALSSGRVPSVPPPDSDGFSGAPARSVPAPRTRRCARRCASATTTTRRSNRPRPLRSTRSATPASERYPSDT